MGKLNSLKDLMVEELKDLYNAEKQITQALPKMAKAASAPELRSAFETHLRQTEGQIARLDQVFTHLDMAPAGKTCRAMKGLLEEGEEMMQEKADPDVMDAALITAAQRVEHYEIAGYGCVRTFAEQLGLNQVAELLQQTLNEEKETDLKLSALAERKLNAEAIAA